jgi:hypothetical protein
MKAMLNETDDDVMDLWLRKAEAKQYQQWR